MPDPSEVIRSRTNARLKRARAVGRGREAGLVLLEGERLVADALRPESPLVVEEVFVREGFAFDAAGAHAYVVSAEALDGVGSLRTTPPVVAVARTPHARGADELERFAATEVGPFSLLCIAGVADPGNLGALARCAEAAGAAALVVAGEGGARPFGPKALRGSMGSLLRLPVFEVGAVSDALDVLEGAQVASWTAATRGGAELDTAAFGPRVALWLTGETGEADPALARAHGVTIPMAGAVESLNVSVAGALLLYAVRRAQA